MASRLSSPKEYEKLLDRYDTWMFDCDGVLWHDEEVIEGAVDVLKMLRSRSMYMRLNVCFDLSYPLVPPRQACHIRVEQCDQVSEELQRQI
jgi:hypothetical protein